MRIRITGTGLHPARVIDEEVQAAEQAVADAQARLKQIRADSKVCVFLTYFPVSHNVQSNSSGRVRAPHSRKSQPTKSSAMNSY